MRNTGAAMSSAIIAAVYGSSRRVRRASPPARRLALRRSDGERTESSAEIERGGHDIRRDIRKQQLCGWRADAVAHSREYGRG
jgi:hypothetical protein